MGLADLHVHTTFSDGTASVPAVLERAKKCGLDIVAITDHNTVEGALQALELAPQYGIQVIPGVEISTADGHLLALSLQQTVPAGLPLLETVLRVGELGGFCIAPHPVAESMGLKSLGAYLVRQTLRDDEAARILIGIEAYNAQLFEHAANDAARILAERSGIAQTGSSDAHFVDAVGMGMTFFPGSTVAELVAALRAGTTQVRRGRQWSPARIAGTWLFRKLALSLSTLFQGDGLKGGAAPVDEALPI
jgi:predicted metal-dependent phosphoesterase TrpH